MRLPLIVVCLVCLASCNLRRQSGPAASEIVTATAAAPPRIDIESPSIGDEFVVGEEILVTVSASDSVGVNRVQLFVNDQIVRTVSSESLSGDLQMRAILNYVPQASDLGDIALRVVAYRGAVVSPPDAITVVVRRSYADIVATPADSNLPFIPDDGLCRALINVNLNYRTGPGTTNPIITVLHSGTLAPIVGKNAGETWWQLDAKPRRGWVSADFTSEYGDCDAVPTVADA